MWSNVNNFSQFTSNLQNFCGPLFIKDKVYQNLTNQGPATLEDCTINETCVINGVLNACKSYFCDLTVNGTAAISGCTVSNLLKINGTIDAKECDFLEKMEIASTSSYFQKCKMKDVFVEHSCNLQTPELYLVDCYVNGNVTFTANRGRVLVKEGVHIVGQVINGDVFSN